MERINRLISFAIGVLIGIWFLWGASTLVNMTNDESFQQTCIEWKGRPNYQYLNGVLYCEKSPGHYARPDK